MKFRIKNKKKSLTANVEKSDTEDVSEYEERNAEKNKRPFPVEEDENSRFVKKSKKKNEIVPTFENSNAENIEHPEVTSNHEGKDRVAGKRNIKKKNFKPKTGKKPSHSHQNEAEHELRTVFMGNVPVKFKEKDFEKLIGKYGEIENYRIRGAIPEGEKTPKKVAIFKKKFNKNQHSLVAYVVYKSIQDAQNALSLNGQVFEDHHLRVTLSTEKTFDKNRGIFIGNLSYEINEEEIWEFFKDCGEIASVRVITDTKTGLSKGFGYVNFKSEDAVEFALKLNEEKLKNREIRITRLFSQGKLEKLKKKKELNSIKSGQTNEKLKKGRNTRDTPNFHKKFNSKTSKPAIDKPGNKFKRKNLNKVDLKKKKLAEKLLAKPKKKTVPS